MSLFEILAITVAFGICLLLVNKYVPMDATVKKILNIVGIAALCVWLAYVLGVIDYLKRIKT